MINWVQKGNGQGKNEVKWGEGKHKFEAQQHCLFLRVRILERHFDFIQYQHISRNLSTLTDSLANQVLDRHLRHR